LEGLNEANATTDRMMIQEEGHREIFLGKIEDLTLSKLIELNA
jgi:hypothetical protein